MKQAIDIRYSDGRFLQFAAYTMFFRLGFAFTFTLICFALGADAAKIEVGDTPPDYLGRDENGDKVLLAAERGKVVIITFWATWCGPCLAELPVLESIQRQVPKDRLRIFAVNFRQDKRVYREVLKRLPDSALTFLYEQNGFNSRRFGVKSLPHMFMINKAGHVAKIHLGYSEKALPGIIDEINALLLEPFP